METRPRAVGEYLRRLERSLRDIPGDRRSEIVTEIEEHIAELLAELGPSPSEASVLNLLERVGDPDDIAVEAREGLGTWPPQSRWTDIAAVVALPIPLIGWIVGAVLLWISDVWDTRDKVIGTIAGPGVLVLGGIAVAASSSDTTRPDPLPGGGEVEVADGGLGPLEVMVLGLLFLGPVVVAVYLARKLRRPDPRKGGSSSGGPSIADLSAIGLLVLGCLLTLLGAGVAPAVAAGLAGIAVSTRG